jgi:hypothetical protein
VNAVITIFVEENGLFLETPCKDQFFSKFSSFLENKKTPIYFYNRLQGQPYKN